MKKRKFNSGGSVRASQADVRKADKHNIKNMPDKEAERVKRSEIRRENEAYADVYVKENREGQHLNNYAETFPRATMKQYDADPIRRKLQADTEHARNNAADTNTSARWVIKGGDDYQYKNGGPVRGCGKAMKGTKYKGFK